MGLFKELELERLERGYEESSKFVCADCVGETGLRLHVERNGNIGECSFCKKKSVRVRSVTEMAGIIFVGLGYEYNKAIEELAWDEGEYVSPGGTWDTSELLEEVLGCASNEDFLLELQQIAVDDCWCDRDAYADTDTEIRIGIWKCFCKLVKHHMRYVFFQSGQWKRNSVAAEGNSLLRYVMENVQTIGLVRSIPKGTKFYRGRKDTNKYFHEAESLAAPPEAFAQANRMSAAGISVFYGAENEMIVQSELVDECEKAGNCLSIGVFKNIDTLNVLDLTRVERMDLPSLFLEETRDKREVVRFFKAFVGALVQPIKKKEGIIDYIPTQILAEYFRYIYRYDGIHTLNGIVYPSASNIKGKCYILFFEHRDCLMGDSQKMVFDSEAVTTYSWQGKVAGFVMNDSL